MPNAKCLLNSQSKHFSSGMKHIQMSYEQNDHVFFCFLCTVISIDGKTYIYTKIHLNLHASQRQIKTSKQCTNYLGTFLHNVTDDYCMFTLFILLG